MMGDGLRCADCPYISCNNHPYFYLARECARQRQQELKNEKRG